VAGLGRLWGEHDAAHCSSRAGSEALGQNVFGVTLVAHVLKLGVEELLQVLRLDGQDGLVNRGEAI
jgi:hypothetical protein